jgi:hypothetical protein
MTIQGLIKLKESSYTYFTETESLKAVNRNGNALRYVKNQTDEICLEAVKQNTEVLVYVDEDLL